MEFYTKVAGVTFSNTGANTENRQRIIAQLSRKGILEPGTELTLRRDPTNPYDANAVAVIAPDGRQIGFLPMDVAAKVSPDMASGARYKAYVAAVTGGDADALYGINLKIVKEEAQTAPASKTAPSICPDRGESVSMSDFEIENGVLIEYTGPGGNVVVPEGVRNIGGHATHPVVGDWVGAFASCKRLEHVVLPEGLQNIWDGAFYGCAGLASISLPKSLQSIGKTAFYGCKNLTIYASEGSYAAEYAREHGIRLITEPRNLFMSKGDFVIENSALIWYTGPGGDVVVPKGLQSIGDNAFYGCTGLTSITLPDGLQSIGNDAFNGCVGLTSITLPKSLQSIGVCAFEGCEGLTSITLPDGLQSIWSYAFNGCVGLTSITLPKSLQSIGGDALNGCVGLTSITLPDGIQSIEDQAFYGCKGLTSITLPDGLQSIGAHAFYGCEGLTSITLPESMQSIGVGAFSGCKRLTSITFPKSLQYIGWNAFGGCDDLAIYAFAGSYAAEYAREHGIRLITEPRNFQAAAPKESSTGISKGNAKPNLLICPDCGRTVSRRAAACPHCGCPIAIILAEQTNETG